MSEARYVLDASIVLASVLEEPGAEAFDDRLPRSMISAVNLAEVIAKLQERGTDDKEILDTLAGLRLDVIDFDTTQAIRAGRLRTATRAQGLSLGDRACLALAIAGQAVAVTTDRSWATLQLPVEILVVRD